MSISNQLLGHYLEPIFKFNTLNLRKPQDRESLFQRVGFSLSTLAETAKHLLRGEGQMFDGVAGDCSCQIRALEVLNTRKENSDESLQALLGKVERSVSLMPALDTEELSIDQVYELCDIEVSDEIFDLVLARSLTKAKVTVSLEDGRLRDIVDHKLLGLNGSGALISRMQSTLSERSIEHLSKCSISTYKGADLATVTDLFTSSVKTSGSRKKGGVSSFPFYHGLKIILEEIKSKGYPVVFVADDPSFKSLPKKAFVYGEEGFVEADPDLFDGGKLCFVIAGTQDELFDTKLAALHGDRVEDVILANSAFHSQYVGGGENAIPNTEAQIELETALKTYADLFGSDECFKITHVFCESLTGEEVAS